MIKTYSEALKYETFGDRLEYLRLNGIQHVSPREISNWFYKTPEWESVRAEVILRDGGWDLGIKGMKITGKILVHHIDPITEEDIENWNVDKLFNPDNLITVSVDTHNYIHYRKRIVEPYVERRPGDTTLW